ncbi:hypothetical protein Vadar_009283 [Vaccinium darrowii]|uniref:Uncharacterized protein n=1 Tax=Vaccinium darrowii TaxID=229202 RepID=A0ACB7WZ99_9ERIC|nr:hypothetical protein Vadar_009283 [Vaccinium darrowii]
MDCGNSSELYLFQCNIVCRDRFLYKALVAPVGSQGEGGMCRISDIEDAKAVLSLLPIWISCLVYVIIFTQPSTFFTEQGITMDRTIWRGFDIPPALLQLFACFPLICLIPIYDRFFIPFARAVTRKPSGITVLQRIGIGMFVSIICMIAAAIVEMKRLKIVVESGLVDSQRQPFRRAFGGWFLSIS